MGHSVSGEAVSRLAFGGGEPNTLRGGRSQGDGSCGSGESQGLIVVAFEQAEFRAGTDAAVFEEFEEPAIAFVDSADGVGVIEFGVSEEDEAAAAAAGRAFKFTEITVRTFTVGA